jgi:pimeloyl-ACP methyl ester carboxylesterase
VLPSRIQHYQAFASCLRANVFAPDCRGYTYSTGTPSEAGLIIDARASWDWLRSHSAAPENVLVVGISLGTAVAVQLASALEAEQQLDGPKEHGKEVGVSSHERPRGVVLLAPLRRSLTRTTSLDSCRSSCQSGLSLPLPVSLAYAERNLARSIKSE